MLDTGRKEHWQCRENLPKHAPGEKAYFEYHCFESMESSDSDLWLRSHSAVEVIGEGNWEKEIGQDMTAQERAEAGVPKTYRVQFSDGYEGEVWEDELYTSPQHWHRDDPPSRLREKHEISVDMPELTPSRLTESIKQMRQVWLDEGIVGSAEEISCGLCSDFATAVEAELGSEEREDLQFATDERLGEPTGYEHTWLRFMGRHYDAEAPEGVKDWRRLPIFKRKNRRTQRLRSEYIAAAKDRGTWQNAI
jgi:hypothetical protein